MGQWIKESINLGVSHAVANDIRQEFTPQMRKLFDREVVNEKTVLDFLAKYVKPVRNAEIDLTAYNFKVIALTDTKYPVNTHDKDRYALTETRRRATGDDQSLATGMGWEIHTPTGTQLGLLRMLPLVDPTTHYGSIEFSFEDGTMIVLGTHEPMKRATEMLKGFLGLRITEYYTKHPDEVPKVEAKK